MKKKATIWMKDSRVIVVNDFKSFREGNNVGLIKSNSGESIVINLDRLEYIKVIECREEGAADD